MSCSVVSGRLSTSFSAPDPSRTPTGNNTIVVAEGRVGIGGDPDTKHRQGDDDAMTLKVHGTLGCTGVKINGWTLSADDVFEDDYQLMGLAELERYVQETRHLPDVPSSDDMKKNGVDLGELCISLLRRVEELSLHLVAQNKRIAALEGSHSPSLECLG